MLATKAICPNSMGEAACRSFESGSRILSVKRQLRLNRGQPKRLHLSVQRKAFVEVLRQGFGSCRIARHGKRKRGFDLDTLTRGSELQGLLPLSASLPQRLPNAASRKSGILLPDCPTFLAVSADGGVHRPLGQFPRLAQMTSVCFGVGCERKPKVLIVRLARKPQLLFRHRSGVRPEKSQSIESNVENEIIQFSRLRLLDDLSRFIEALQGERRVGEILVCCLFIRCEAKALRECTSVAFSYCPRRAKHSPDRRVRRCLAGSSRSPPDTSVPLSPVPRLRSDSSQR